MSYMCNGLGVFPLIFRYHVRGVDVLPLDPLIVRIGVSFPLDQVLYLTSTPELSGIDNTLHFIFFFSIDKVRRRSRVIGSVSCRFLIWCEEIHMKHRVYLPLFRQSELICDRA